MNRKTLAIIKPDMVKENKIGEIITMITQAGFKIKAIKMVRLTRATAEGFYEIHKDRSFFGDLIEYMTSGPCIPILLEKDSAVVDFRKLIGATDPSKAAEGTIRKLYAHSIRINAVHGSDSIANAEKEIAHFFSRKELLENYSE